MVNKQTFIVNETNTYKIFSFNIMLFVETYGISNISSLKTITETENI